MNNELLTVTDLNGNSEALIGFKGFNYERTVNGEKIISFILFSIPQNEHSFPLVQEESIIEFKGEKFAIKKANYKSKGKTFYKEVVGVHKFFNDMSNDRIYESYTQSLTFINALNIVFDNSGYTFEVIGQFYAEDWENFGKDNRLKLFQDVLNRYGAEFEIIGENHIRLIERAGNQTDFQFRFNYNIKTLDYQVSTDNLFTYIKGTGERDENDVPLVVAEYTSPNAEIFGIRHANEIDDKRFTSVETLTQHLKDVLTDEPEVSVSLDFIDMRSAGYPK